MTGSSLHYHAIFIWSVYLRGPTPFREVLASVFGWVFTITHYVAA